MHRPSHATKALLAPLVCEVKLVDVVKLAEIKSNMCEHEHAKSKFAFGTTYLLRFGDAREGGGSWRRASQEVPCEVARNGNGEPAAVIFSARIAGWIARAPPLAKRPVALVREHILQLVREHILQLVREHILQLSRDSILQ